MLCICMSSAYVVYFRESLKGTQQSAHFWSFQMAPCSCECASKNVSTRARCNSMQNLDKVDINVHQRRSPPKKKLFERKSTPTPCLHSIPIEFSRRDVGTETGPLREDKSVGPECPVKILKPCARLKPP